MTRDPRFLPGDDMSDLIVTRVSTSLSDKDRGAGVVAHAFFKDSGVPIAITGDDLSEITGKIMTIMETLGSILPDQVTGAERGGVSKRYVNLAAFPDLAAYSAPAIQYALTAIGSAPLSMVSNITVPIRISGQYMATLIL